MSPSTTSAKLYALLLGEGLSPVTHYHHVLRSSWNVPPLVGKFLSDAEPDDCLQLIRNEIKFRGYRPICLSQCSIRTEPNRNGEAVRAEHPRIERYRLWIIGVPEVLPERPGFGSRLGINWDAVRRSENVLGFRQVMTEDATGVVAREQFTAGIFDARPLAARAEHGEARTDFPQRPSGAFGKQYCLGVLTGVPLAALLFGYRVGLAIEVADLGDMPRAR